MHFMFAPVSCRSRLKERTMRGITICLQVQLPSPPLGGEGRVRGADCQVSKPVATDLISRPEDNYE